MSQESALIKSSRTIKRIFLYFFLFVITYYSWGGIVAIINNFEANPIDTDYTPYRDNDDAFGQINLPIIEPKLAISDNSNPIFTISGDFPNFQDRIFVYKVYKAKESFLTVTRANQASSRLGFGVAYSKPDDIIMKWTDSYRFLEMNKDGLTWNLKSDESFFEVISSKPPKNQTTEDFLKESSEGIVSLLLPHIENFDFSKPNFYQIEPNEDSVYGFELDETGESKIYLVQYEQLIDSLPLKNSSKAEEEVTKLNIPKKIKIIGTNPYISRLKSIVHSSYPQIENLVGLDYVPIRFGEQSVYKIISPSEAFTLLQEGKGSLRSLNVNDAEIFENFKEHSISEFNVDGMQTEIAYFLEDRIEGVSYTYPVYVFKGEAVMDNGETANFVFYVDALNYN